MQNLKAYQSPNLAACLQNFKYGMDIDNYHYTTTDLTTRFLLSKDEIEKIALKGEGFCKYNIKHDPKNPKKQYFTAFRYCQRFVDYLSKRYAQYECWQQETKLTEDLHPALLKRRTIVVKLQLSEIMKNLEKNINLKEGLKCQI